MDTELMQTLQSALCFTEQLQECKFAKIEDDPMWVINSGQLGGKAACLASESDLKC